MTQSENMIARSGSIVVVAYNDSRDAPGNYTGISRSEDGGLTFNRLLPSPFASGHGTNWGDPLVVYDRKHGLFIAVFLAGDCGGQGLGTWTSVNGLTWSAASCAHSGTSDDRASIWIDNNPSSAYYGRTYVSYNDYNVGAGALMVVHADDASTWSAPVTVYSSFIRDVQLTGSPGSDGHIYLMAMNEGGGGLNNRQNILYYSSDGGATWNSVTIGSPFSAAGDTTCTASSYFAMMNPIWRYMGWGQPAAGAAGLVVYDYTAHGISTDSGDIFFTRSTDYGATWSAPFKLNSDSGLASQWQPSLAITDTGDIVATWYDRRNSSDGANYEIYYRVSNDGGLTWQLDRRLSDQLIPEPLQQDPNVQACYAGDYNNAVAYRDTVHVGWTDGRVSIAGNPQQDVVVAQIKPMPGMAVLYDQYDHLDLTGSMGGAAISQDFSTQDTYDSQAADDFIIPSGAFWKIEQVEAPGVLSGALGPTFNVFLYTDSGNKPGTQIFAQTAIVAQLGLALDGGRSGAVLLSLSGAGWLTAGHYWISVQAASKDDFGWYFYMRTLSSNSPSVWRNPNDGVGRGCITWTLTNNCTGYSWTPDLGFRLHGYSAPFKE